jgi:hypothetical protein
MYDTGGHSRVFFFPRRWLGLPPPPCFDAAEDYCEETYSCASVLDAISFQLTGFGWCGSGADYVIALALCYPTCLS